MEDFEFDSNVFDLGQGVNKNWKECRQLRRAVDRTCSYGLATARVKDTFWILSKQLNLKNKY